MIEEAARRFKKGGIVVFPTDTVYGIGCDVRNESSIRRVYEIRGDTEEKPVLILTANLKQAYEYGVFGDSEKRFAEKYWPGPLTSVVKSRQKTPRIIRGKGETIGIRIPNQPTILEIIRKLGAPIIAPSANYHGSKPPKVFSEIDKHILALVDYTINLVILPKKIEMEKKPSTIIDLTCKPFKILRQGAVPKNQLMMTMKGANK